MMSDVLADLDPGVPIEKEKDVPPPKWPHEPKVSVSKTPNPVGLTMKTSLPRSWLSKTAITGLLVFTLGWCVSALNIDKWIGSTFHIFSSAVSNFVAPPYELVSPDPASTAGPDNLSTMPKPDGLTDNKEIRVPRSAGIEPSSQASGHN
jgi:hypothetical protein